jgi:predicted O-linked N-acetylglucosamine transferase (SPINDLY family)
LLHGAGLPELVTENLSDYEALALRLGKDTALLEALKRRLADHNARVTLFDAESYRRQIEAAYLKMWEIYQSGASPRSFIVEAN